MKCIKCGRKEKSFNGGSCSNCGHEVVADESVEGVSDQDIKKAIDAVSARQTLFYLPSHLLYELKRMLTQRNRRREANDIFYYAFTVLIAADFVPQEYSVHCVFFALVLVIYGLVTKFNTKYPENPAKLIKRFLDVNPDPWVLDYNDPALINKIAATLEPIQLPLQHLLICEQNRYARFLLSNEFHLLAGCPILGPQGNDDTFFPGLIDTLRNRGDYSGDNKLKIFIVHNFTPAGERFVSKVKAQWFGGMDVDVIDMGLNAEHRPLFEQTATQLKFIPASGYNRSDANKPGAELATIAPQNLLKITQQGIDETAAFAIPIVMAASNTMSSRSYE